MAKRKSAHQLQTDRRGTDQPKPKLRKRPKHMRNNNLPLQAFMRMGEPGSKQRGRVPTHSTDYGY